MGNFTFCERLLEEFMKFSRLLAEHSYVLVRLSESKAETRILSFHHNAQCAYVCTVVRTKRAEMAAYDRYLTVMIWYEEKDNRESDIVKIIWGRGEPLLYVIESNVDYKNNIII